MLLLYFTTCRLFILVYCKKLSLREYIVHMFLYILQSFHHLLYFIGLQNLPLQRLHSPYASYIFNCQSFITCYYITIDSAAETLESICFLGILLFVSHFILQKTFLQNPYSPYAPYIFHYDLVIHYIFLLHGLSIKKYLSQLKLQSLIYRQWLLIVKHLANRKLLELVHCVALLIVEN